MKYNSIAISRELSERKSLTANIDSDAFFMPAPLLESLIKATTTTIQCCEYQQKEETVFSVQFFE